MKNNNQQTDSLFGTSAFFKASDVIIYPNIDMGGGAFAHGQLYVALSRLTSIDGLILRRTITFGGLAVVLMPPNRCYTLFVLIFCAVGINH